MHRSIPSRSLLTATWLGWKIESNWTDPLLFAIYSIVKPLAAAAILVVMYSIISQADFQSPVFAYLFIGNAFYQYVASVLTGVSWAIIDDREHYRTLKYIYTAPINIPIFLLGRGVARFLTSSFAVIITMGMGMIFFKLPINLKTADWGLFLISLALGIFMLSMLGLLLAGISLRVAQHAGGIGEAVGGGLFLFSGAIFPISVLPAWLQPVGYALPVSYWLELIRRALLGSQALQYSTFPALSNLQLLGILIAMTAFWSVLSIWLFRVLEHSAREKGNIDLTTNY
jgi:ABC-2 type transport system permease protein